MLYDREFSVMSRGYPTLEPVRDVTMTREITSGGVNEDFKDAVKRGGDVVNNVVDRVTGAGDEIKSAGDAYTDFLIDFATGLQNRTTQTATENLKGSKINSYFEKAGLFVKNNALAVAGAFAGLIVLIAIIRRV